MTINHLFKRFRINQYFIAFQTMLECLPNDGCIRENGERFRQNGERFSENGERFSAARHPLAGIRASVGRRRGRTRGRASARDDLKNTFHLSQGSLESLCAKAFREVTGRRGTLTSLHRAFTPLRKGCGSTSVPSTPADL